MAIQEPLNIAQRAPKYYVPQPHLAHARARECVCVCAFVFV